MAQAESESTTTPKFPDQEQIERWAKAEADASPAKAFDIASGMEDDLTDIGRLVDAIRFIADGIDDEHRASNALYGIAQGIERHLKAAEESRQEIFQCTWSYKHGKRREDGVPTAQEGGAQ